MMSTNLLIFFILTILNFRNGAFADDNQNTEIKKSFEEENYGVRYADDCEVCKYTAAEFEARLKETGQSYEVLDIGGRVEEKKKKVEYKKSELRFIETMENVCDRLLEYNVHKERKDSTRFARGISQTFQTLDNLVKKGVKVDLGIPEKLWDKPSAEITDLKSKCERLLERYEDEIEQWYMDEERTNLSEYLCSNRFLKDKDSKCLSEKAPDNSEVHQPNTENVKNEL